ncbi:MAG: exosortase/archaeosortase family protein [Planctomycetota bacterium]|nr:exosortase/archaeosortase family protein [Planctomycetota bacterium]
MSSLSRDDPQAGSQLPVRSLELQQPRLDAGQLRGLAIGGAIVLALLLWLFWHFFARQFRIAIHHQADWGHTLVIPLIAGYFVYLNRHRLLATGFKTTWVGLIPMVLGTAWYMFCWLGPITLVHHNLQGAGLSLTLFGIVLLFFGYRATSYLLFPLLYLCIFGQGISDRLMNYVTFPLQDITARGSYLFLKLIDVDIERRGNILTIYDDGVAKPLNVSEACSGMRMLVAFLALGVAMAYTGFKHFWQRVTLVLMGVPIAIFVNILRVATLALLSLVDSDFTAGDFHTFIGLLWLVPALLIYLGLIWILRHLIIEEEPSGGGPQLAAAAPPNVPMRSES